MRVATVDGLVTLFCDGSKLLYSEELEDEFFEARGSVEFNDVDLADLDDDLSDACRKYFKERSSWQQIIIQEGVTEIPRRTFSRCYNIKRVMVAIPSSGSNNLHSFVAKD
ncbi:predicted protein [Chaetoceros tenuissimus]|uniref:Uncharacterized protein n=1 Tax=Chaetoceros tenuissimus TaxID=426638 RepID=A0AAD3CKC3_9STRA|nr:predicted protein [Chaetoceros tenuissimus]